MKSYFVAAGIGYLLGTLWAPKKGALLRDEIRKHFKDIQSEAEDFKSNASETISRASDHIVKANDTAKNAFAKLDKSVHEIVQTT